MSLETISAIIELRKNMEALGYGITGLVDYYHLYDKSKTLSSTSVSNKILFQHLIELSAKQQMLLRCGLTDVLNINKVIKRKDIFSDFDELTLMLKGAIEYCTRAEEQAKRLELKPELDMVLTLMDELGSIKNKNWMVFSNNPSKDFKNIWVNVYQNNSYRLKLMESSSRELIRIDESVLCCDIAGTRGHINMNIFEMLMLEFNSITMPVIAIL